MSREANFWRNAAIITAVHIALLFGLAHWSGSAKTPVATDILWMDSSAGVTNEVAPTAMPEIAPEPTPEPSAAEEQPSNEQAIVTPVKSEMELPRPTPTATATATPRPTPSPTATPKSTPKPSPKPTPVATPKPTPKKMVVAKASPSPRSRSTPAEDPKELVANSTPSKIASAGVASETGNAEAAGSGGRGGGTAGASQFGWYSSMLHDRFFGEWIQPKTALAMGAKMSALVQLRIENDGRVTSFEIVRSSGNVVVDESVAAVAKRVTKVDPLPAGMASAGHYDVKIKFELSVE